METRVENRVTSYRDPRTPKLIQKKPKKSSPRPDPRIPRKTPKIQTSTGNTQKIRPLGLFSEKTVIFVASVFLLEAFRVGPWEELLFYLSRMFWGSKGSGCLSVVGRAFLKTRMSG